MLESKIEATHRLQRSGQWNAASLYRDRERLKLRADGNTRAEAREGAWLAMTERFQPPDEKAFRAAGAVGYCPPKVPNGKDQRAFTTAWQATWIVISRLAEVDHPLRVALGIDGLTQMHFFNLHLMLPIDEQEQIESWLIRESEPLADEMLHPRPEPLLEWAEPQLREAFDSIDREAIDGDYECMTFEFLERLVDAWALLEESCEFLWSDVRPEEEE
ncbi:MAG: hypothetical protein O2820_26905 [Planctomycetota bacterium]|nr:hypothetical protein [Planctomycetota bacterium]